MEEGDLETKKHVEYSRDKSMKCKVAKSTLCDELTKAHM